MTFDNGMNKTPSFALYASPTIDFHIIDTLDYNEKTYNIVYQARYYYTFSKDDTTYKASNYGNYDYDYVASKTYFDTEGEALAAAQKYVGDGSSSNYKGWYGAYAQEVYGVGWSGSDTFAYGYYMTEAEANIAMAQCIAENGEGCAAQVINLSAE